jgi:FeS assembly SUF system protein
MLIDVFMVNKISLEIKIVEVLKTVHDPELPSDIYELGLVYDINISDNGFVNIKMTLTAPGCPVAGDIIMEVDNKIRAIEGVSDVNVMLTFDPPWRKDMMSEEAKLELGFL